MNDNKIEIIKNSHYEKPNYYALFPVLEATLDLKNWSEMPSSKEHADILKNLIPDLKNHACSKGYKGGFIERLEEGTYPEHIIEHMTIAFQNMIGENITYGKSRKLDENLFQIAVEYEHKSVASEALKGSVEVLNSIYAEDKSEKELKLIVDETIKNEKKAYERDRLGPSTKAILDAAKRRDIPIEKLHDEYSFYALGQGKYRKNIWGPVTSDTSMIGGDISKDKKLCKEILYKNGFSVPRGELARTKDEVLEIAEDIGYPVILKPVKGHHGQGVLGDLRSKEEVLSAYDITSKYSDYILVEDFVRGDDYRFLVINNKVIAAANRIPAHVVGDGRSTIDELVKDINEDPRRGEGHRSTLTKIKLGEEEKAHLELTGKGPEYIPEKDEKVLLRIGGNLSTGGTSKDVTDIVHRSIIEEVERLSKVIDMDILGVDIVAEDITEHKDETEWHIIETNASPGLRMHVHPNEGSSKKVGKKIVDMLFPEHNGRIPIISVTGTNGKTTTSRLIDWIAREEGYTTGLTVTDGIWIDGKKIIDGDTTGPWSARVVLNNKDVNFAVFETARGGIIRKGLGFDRCDVGVVTNIREDHIGMDGIKDIYDIFRVKSLILEVTKRDGRCVINANSRFCDELIERSSGKPVLFATSFNERIKDHIRKGEEAFYVKNGKIFHVNNKNKSEI
ncbi:MAG: cyanophycin synthetase family protein, partial [Thermoplasmatota archaeon]